MIFIVRTEIPFDPVMKEGAILKRFDPNQLLAAAILAAAILLLTFFRSA
jgi:hypothetical protein